MTKEQAKKLGKQLDSYMQFRTGREGMQYGLTSDFYEKALLDGAVEFFGITFANGKLTYDAQNPIAFRQWQQRH